MNSCKKLEVTWPQFKKKFYKKLNLKGQRDHKLRVYVASIQDHGKRPLEVSKTMTPNRKQAF